MLKKYLGWFIGLVVVAIVVGNELDLGEQMAPFTPVEPDWVAISAWPALDGSDVEAAPDPNRQITAIVLDDSGSMSSEMEVAKQAVVGALDTMQPTDRVAVVALNKGVVLDFMTVEEARLALPEKIRPVRSDGSTPLTQAIQTAHNMLAAEGARARAFGTYRIIVTTDGAADEPGDLRSEIEEIARVTPIQVATIGIGVEGGHVLRRPAIASFVDISNASALGEALTKAIAESQDFSAVTSFGEN